MVMLLAETADTQILTKEKRETPDSHSRWDPDLLFAITLALGMPREAAARRQVRALSGRQTREPHHGSASYGVVRRRSQVLGRCSTCFMSGRSRGPRA